MGHVLTAGRNWYGGKHRKGGGEKMTTEIWNDDEWKRPYEIFKEFEKKWNELKKPGADPQPQIKVRVRNIGYILATHYVRVWNNNLKFYNSYGSNPWEYVYVGKFSVEDISIIEIFKGS